MQEPLLPSKLAIENRFERHKHNVVPTDFRSVDIIPKTRDVVLFQN